MYIHKHILVGSNIDYYWSKKNNEPIVEHDNIVIHYSAGSAAISTVQYLASEKTMASAHLVIGRDSRIYQLVDFNTQAWHAGRSHYLGKTGQNAYSVGIELENAGLLHERNKRYYTWFGKRIPDEQVIQLVNPQTGFHAWWHTYTEIQLKTLKNVIGLLLYHYKFNRVVGHSEISLTGKIDPGPAFPMDEFKNLIYR
jgi:N-acetylmuramoyl-L-alanine amidase